jgi:SAM-dependent methyltransferase
VSRLNYLWRSVVSRFSPARHVCPNCGSAKNSLVSRKYIVTELRRCAGCYLLFRTPTDDPTKNQRYYEHEYSQGFTTDMPSDEKLATLIQNNFAGTEKSWDYYNGILKQLGLCRGERVFDFGCSWGYGSYQMAAAGYGVVALEVSPTRRRYAEQKLGVVMVQDAESAVRDPNLAGTFACFFTAHVLEHVPNPKVVFNLAAKLLRPGGLFVSFTPNGSLHAKAAWAGWNKAWGEVHPNFIDDRFLNRAFEDSPRVIGSSPVSRVELPSDAVLKRLNELTGPELFFAAQVLSPTAAARSGCGSRRRANESNAP